jgi:hypothetical protein
MKSSILPVMIVTAGLLLLPVIAYAQTGQPPVSQPLVREGTLALKLAEGLHLGTPSNEAEAESALSEVGIAPKNGWIADYPVTPDIAGELENAVASAADSKSIKLGRDEAMEAFHSVMMSFDLPAGPTGQSVATNAFEEEQTYNPGSTVINNYYYDEGPPVVTYYAPPPDYAYLYTWVPYPFWWSDFWFPGFFVLNDFDITVHGNGHFHHGRDFDHQRGGEHFTNHFRDRRSGEMRRIDPANRAHGGTFASRSSGWGSTSARSGARAILNERIGRTNVRNGWSGWRGSSVSPYRNGWNRRNYSGADLGSPVYHGWNNSSRRMFGNRGSSYSGRTYTRFSAGNRNYNSYRGGTFRGNGSTHAFQARAGSWRSYGGWHGRSGVGGSVRSFGGWHSGVGSHSFGGWRGGSFGGRK